MIVQGLGGFEPTDAVYPIDKIGHGLGFTGLQLADEVPHDIVLGDCCDFLMHFLPVVLAEMSLSGLIGLHDFSNGLGLADRDQLDAIWVALAAEAGLFKHGLALL